MLLDNTVQDRRDTQGTQVPLGLGMNTRRTGAGGKCLPRGANEAPASIAGQKRGTGRRSCHRRQRPRHWPSPEAMRCATFSGQRICSSSSDEEVPCSSCSSRCAGLGQSASSSPAKAAAVEPLLTSSAFPSCETLRGVPRLVTLGTMASADSCSRRRSLLNVVPIVADGLGLQASLSKNVNSRGTTGPFISGTEHRTALCRAACPLRQPYMVFLFVGSSALTSGFLPTEPRDSAVASV